MQPLFVVFYMTQAKYLMSTLFRPPLALKAHGVRSSSLMDWAKSNRIFSYEVIWRKSRLTSIPCGHLYSWNAA
jgi:hypothetical protein